MPRLLVVADENSDSYENTSGMSECSDYSYFIDLNSDLDSRDAYTSNSIRQCIWKLLLVMEGALIRNKNASFPVSQNTFKILSTFCAKYISNVSVTSSSTLEIRLYMPHINLNAIKVLVLWGGSFEPFTIDNKKKNVRAIATFFPSPSLAKGIPISTPLTFPFIDNSIVLTFDKNGWWNPLGGHIENGESWTDTLYRESKEEAGVDISRIKTFGYIKVAQLSAPENAPYPMETIIPMSVSRVDKYYEEWTPMETTSRGVFSTKEAFSLLKSRTDGGQMLQIYSYLLFLVDNSLLSIS